MRGRGVIIHDNHLDVAPDQGGLGPQLPHHANGVVPVPVVDDHHGEEWSIRLRKLGRGLVFVLAPPR